MTYGYARTTTDDQTMALQMAALRRPRCAHIFEDNGLSGATQNALPLPSAWRSSARRHAHRVEAHRLGRSLRDLITMLDDLRARGVKFHSLTEAYTATPTGRAMWQMIGV